MEIFIDTLMITNIDEYTTDNDFGYFCDPSILEYTPPKKYDINKYRENLYTIYENDLESYNDEYSTPPVLVKKKNSTKLFIYGSIALGSIMITNILISYHIL
jgi:hypothetical protein